MAKEFVEQMHRQVEELVRARVSGLEQDISRLQREVNHAFTSLLERTDSASVIPDEDVLLSNLVASVEGEIGKAGEDSARLGSDLALLRDGVDHLGKQTTQAEVLNALVERASSFAPRLLLFVVKADNALGWAGGGTEPPLDKTAVRGIAIPLGADTILRAALTAQQTFYGTSGDQKDNQLITGRLGQTAPERMLAAPLKVRGKSAAVLYADSSDRDGKAVNVEAIELLVSTTGFVVELTSLRARVGDASTAARPQGAAERGEIGRVVKPQGRRDLRRINPVVCPKPRILPDDDHAEQEGRQASERRGLVGSRRARAFGAHHRGPLGPVAAPPGGRRTDGEEPEEAERGAPRSPAREGSPARPRGALASGCQRRARTRRKGPRPTTAPGSRSRCRPRSPRHGRRCSRRPRGRCAEGTGPCRAGRGV